MGRLLALGDMCGSAVLLAEIHGCLTNRHESKAPLPRQSHRTGAASASGNPRLRKTGKKRSVNYANGFRPGTTRSLMSFGKESNYNSRTGWIFSWRTTPNRLFAQRRPTRPTSEPACISNKHSASVQSAISAQMISSITFGADCRRKSRSRPLPVSSQKAALSRRPSTRNCGFFAV